MPKLDEMERIARLQERADEARNELREARLTRRRRINEVIAKHKMLTADDQVRAALVNAGAIQEDDALTEDDILLLGETGRYVEGHPDYERVMAPPKET